MNHRLVGGRRLLVAVGVLTAALAGPAFAGLDPDEPVASVEGISEYRLDNGLRVVLVPDNSKQQITVNITYFVGSRHEGYGETGMAHLLEHMLFQGTPDHPDIPQELTDRGAQPNGTTWTDRTNYFETFKATRDNLEWALDLEADRMINSRISAEDLESEMTVVRNEWEAGENRPFNVLIKRTLSTAFQWHNYGNSTIGARSDIENVPVPRLRAFYEKYYQPDNAMLVVAGQFDTAEALALIEDKFGAIERPERSGANTLYDTYTREPVQDGERSVTLRRVGDDKIVMAVYHVPPGSHEDFAAISILSRILADEPSGRLYKALVETGKAASVNTFPLQWKEPSVLIAGARVRESKSLAPAREALIETVESFAAQPPSEEAVERARNELGKHIKRTFKDTERIAKNLSEWAAMGDWRMFFIHRDRIEAVTPDDVQRVADRYLLPSNRTLGEFLPTDEKPARAEIPEAPDVTKLVEHYEGGKAVVKGEDFDPTPEIIDARTERFEFDSGFELAVLPKQNRGDTVVATLTLRLGNADALAGHAAAGHFVGNMLMRGTERHTRQQIQDTLDRWETDLSMSSGPTELQVQIQSDREHLPKVLGLLQEIFEQPAFPEKEWKLLKEESLAGLEQQRTDPQARASRRLQRAMQDWPAEHPLYTPTFDESIERLKGVNLSEVKAFYRRFYGASGGTMAIVGDVDVGQARSRVQSIFADWTPQVPYERIAKPYREIPGEALTVPIADKANAVMLASTMLEIRDDDPRYPELVMGNYMLGGGFLASRLTKRIREKDGLSYGVGSHLQASAFDTRAQFLGFAIFAPENAEPVEKAFFEEIDKVLKEGFTEDELARAKRGWLDNQKVQRGKDTHLAAVLNATLHQDRTMAFTKEMESAVAELDVDEVNAAMREYLNPESLVLVKAGDL